jgi:hypothetical protein
VKDSFRTDGLSPDEYVRSLKELPHDQLSMWHNANEDLVVAESPEESNPDAGSGHCRSEK